MPHIVSWWNRKVNGVSVGGHNHFLFMENFRSTMVIFPPVSPGVLLPGMWLRAVIVNGGTVDAKQIRSSGGGGLASYHAERWCFYSVVAIG